MRKRLCALLSRCAWAAVARVRMAGLSMPKVILQCCCMPIIDQFIRDAEHASYSMHGTSPHYSWCMTELVTVPPMGSGYRAEVSAMSLDYSGYTYRAYWDRIAEVVKHIYGYPGLSRRV